MTEELEPARPVSTWLVDEDAWEHDEETGGQVAMLVDTPAVQAGMWRPGRSGLGPIEVDLQHTEVLYVLAGTGRLVVDDGAPVDLLAGRAVRIEAGSHAHFVVDAEFREVWFYV
jgi:uncharacterized cupin superfamily protein